MTPWLNQLYAGLNAPNDATVNQWIANTQAPAPVVSQPAAPPAGTIIMPGRPVDPNAPVLAGVPTQFQAQPAPLPQPAPAAPPAGAPIQGQPVGMGASGPTPPQGVDASVSYNPTTGRDLATFRAPGGEQSRLSPAQKKLMSEAAYARGGEAVGAADEMRMAMASPQSAYLNRVNQLMDMQDEARMREKSHQGARDLRLNQLDEETDKLAAMKVDPERYKSDLGNAASGFMAAILGGALAKGGPNRGLEDFRAKEDRDIRAQLNDQQQQAGKVANLRETLQQSEAGNQAGNAAMQNVQALAQHAGELESRAAAIDVDMAKAKADGDMAKVQELAALREKYASALVRVGGGNTHMVQLPTGAIVPMSDAQYLNYRLKENEEIQKTGGELAKETVKAREAKDGKDDIRDRIVEAGDKRFVARTKEQAIQYDKERRDNEETQAALANIGQKRKDVSFGARLWSSLPMAQKLYVPPSVGALQTAQASTVEKLAKQSGGVVTDSDREGVRQRLGDQSQFSLFTDPKVRLNEMLAETQRKKELLDRGPDGIVSRMPSYRLDWDKK